MVAAGYAQVTLHGVRFANGSGLRLRHLVTENDITDFLGREIGLLLIDEGAHFTESSYRILRTRCRVSGEVAKCGLWPKIIVAAMPGGLGHLWVRRTWVDRGPFEIWRTPESEGGLLRQFLRSRLEDNPSLLSANPTYRQQLEGLGDPIMTRAMLLGDRTVISGSMFASWRPDRHIIPPFDIPSSWEVWRGMDDGFHAPAAVVWLIQNPDTKRIYVVDELYRAGMTPEMVVDLVGKRDGAIAGSRLEGICDNSAFSNLGTGLSRGELMNNLWLRWQPAEKGPGSPRGRYSSDPPALSELGA